MRGSLQIIFVSMILLFINTLMANVQITQLTDIHLGTYNGVNATRQGSTNACIFSSSLHYSVTVTTNLGGFVITNGVSYIPFEVIWDADGASQYFVGFPMIHGMGHIDEYSKPLVSSITADCSGFGPLGPDPLAQMTVSIPGENFTNTTAGLYGTTINIMVALI